MSRIPSMTKAHEEKQRRDPIQEAKNHGWKTGVYFFTKAIEELWGPAGVEAVRIRIDELIDEEKPR